MLSRFRTVIVAVSVLLFAGCATVHKQAFNKAANPDIKTIAVLEPATNREYSVANLGHAGMAFGLIGGLVAAADIQSKTDRFTKIVQSKSFDLSSEFQTNIVNELQNAGYIVKPLKVQRAKPEFLDTYDNLDQGADAYLDLGVSSGYLCASGVADYVPTVRSGVRLVRRNTKEVLYQDIVSYGYENRAGQAVSIPAQQQYFFKDFDAIMTEPERALEGMRAGIPLVAKRIVQDLVQ